MTVYVHVLYRRIGPMEADPAIIMQLHNQLIPDLENSDDSGSDEEEDACAGWEAVSCESCSSTFVNWPTTQRNRWILCTGAEYRLSRDDSTYS